MKHLVRFLPPVHEIQKAPKFAELLEQYGIDHIELTKTVKDSLDGIRELILNEKWDGPKPGDGDFLVAFFDKVKSELKKRYNYTLKPVINATGTILHTNLGRARISDNAMKHVMEIAQYYSNLEYKLEEGERGSRHTHVESLIKHITGAEAAMVVNNNAAAVYLILRALAHDKEVIVSRGQLVEIGGSFRISSIMEESGATLKEVGTTNKTHLYDYERAISEETAMLMKVHTSNFKVIGFTKSVETEELVGLAKRHEHVIVYEDLGSGALYDFSRHGIGDEPVVGQVLNMGVDIVSFSGDKLLGGPQAGIIAGKKELIDLLKKNQLARVVRVDKMTLAALEGTLLDYVKGEESIKNIPTVRDLLSSKEEIKERSEVFVRELLQVSDRYSTSVQEDISQVGGGTMPDVELPTYVVVLKHKDFPTEKVAGILRTENEPGIIVRIRKEEILLDLRCVTRNEEKLVLEALSRI
ncbi:L-seryl-tRNA(Sec) selenium transferase [Cytobacillus sp. FJAT-54145]|uniref:L-seryl-tRNA(Sec) selenium transferase n=1 Tax=Cytobacillus spartinae TaxID=3299023 RepID=A0ABW6K557_9BACI